ncbi:uncharacterized protein PHACADRAFT_246044 [Phanerochaete carnosa HHB-10118-sp]|uniref:Uncharacterized protein n=1 Tax=Phanerochaete carnosa (strain HHB-10118-sp) TaxID=650164 RepID=K5W8B0_PHACS|nr:uncharacterized protein PHACADRAFT_246044 [Phanerochaete carnosa HHB-10118-sp]EKM60193.1 hypothetical protein PHACADRAFT_246044 [Phanerochaete carnosa HHB-10118-sp]
MYRHGRLGGRCQGELEVAGKDPEVLGGSNRQAGLEIAAPSEHFIVEESTRPGDTQKNRYDNLTA